MTTRPIHEVAEIAAQRRLAKRPKRANEEWCVSFTNSESFDRLVKTIEQLTSEATIKIIKKETFTGIKVDITDSTGTCMLKAKLKCPSVDMKDGDEIHFNVAITELKNAMKEKKSSSERMDILKYSGEDGVTIRVYGVPRKTIQLRTIVGDKEGHELQDMDVDYTIQIRAEDLKTFCLSKIGGSDVTFEIREAANSNMTHFTLKREDEASSYESTYSHTTSTSDNGDKILVQCDDDLDPDADLHLEKAKLVYTGTFQISNIIGFLKAIDKGTVWVLLQKDESGEAGPAIIHYNLGQESSYMRLVCGPQWPIDD